MLKGDTQENIEFEKANRIEVSTATKQESVLHVIENNEDVKKFVDSLKVDEWSSAEIPANVTNEYIFTMYQEETIKLGETKNKEELRHIATLTTYKDSPYIELKTKQLTLSFKVPNDVAKDLANY